MRNNNKENPSSPGARYMKRMQQSSLKYYGKIFLVVVFIGLLCYLGNSTHKYLQTDLANTYNVKVLNAETGDALLASLSKDSFSYLAMIDAGSSGCRAHVYRYGKLGSLEGPLYIIPQHDSKKVRHYTVNLFHIWAYTLSVWQSYYQYAMCSDTSIFLFDK